MKGIKESITEILRSMEDDETLDLAFGLRIRVKAKRLSTRYYLIETLEGYAYDLFYEEEEWFEKFYKQSRRGLC